MASFSEKDPDSTVHEFEISYSSMNQYSMNQYVFPKSNIEEIEKFRLYMKEVKDDEFDKDGKKRIGKLCLSKKIIKENMHYGKYGELEVAVKCIPKSSQLNQGSFVNVCFEHTNIRRYYGTECNNSHVYICVEHCQYNLPDLVNINLKITKDPRGLLKSMRNVLRGIVDGLAHLHKNGYVHGNLKPENVLIHDQSAKLSDLGVINPTDWQPKEQMNNMNYVPHSSCDMFTFGCLLFYCITNRHPYGQELGRNIRIKKNKYDLSALKDLPEARELIENLLNSDHNQRFTASKVLLHPVFWDGDKRLSFLKDVSDEGIAISPAIAPISIPWNRRLNVDHFTNANSKKKRYNDNDVFGHDGLLRFIKSSFSHRSEYPQYIQIAIGKCDQDLDDYFSKAFPQLLMAVYNIICNHGVRNKTHFQRKYFM